MAFFSPQGVIKPKPVLTKRKGGDRELVASPRGQPCRTALGVIQDAAAMKGDQRQAGGSGKRGAPTSQGSGSTTNQGLKNQILASL